jgi:sensor histidine kinase YesM
MEERLIDRFWWFLAPKQWWLRHLLFWLYRFNNYVFYGLGLQELDLSEGYFAIIGELLLYIVFVYFHILFLIPKILFRKKIVIYLLGSVLSLFLFPYLENNFYPPDASSTFFYAFHVPFINGVETYLQVTGLRIMVEFLYTQKMLQELKTQNFQTELAYLKSQINPHFLFNTLNNIAVISEKYPEKVTPILIELSNVLRYQLYESEKTSVLLSKEIENLRHYLQLEAMRLNNAQCDLRVEGFVNGFKVAPLLFLPFFENAVKHSANPSGKTTIDILFRIEEKNLIFIAKNSKSPFKSNQLGGIGLKNIQRRLELLYPNKYTLAIDDGTNEYCVKLTITMD